MPVPESTDTALRKQLAQLIEGGEAHIPFAEAVEGFPVSMAGVHADHAPHTAWELIEHMRIALGDIVRFSGVYESRSPGDSTAPKDYVELKWPDDYWPVSAGPDSEEQWNHTIAAIQADLAAFIQFLTDPKNDLFTPFPWGDGQTLLREALLIADHNAYHVGQLVLLRRMLE